VIRPSAVRPVNSGVEQRVELSPVAGGERGIERAREIGMFVLFHSLVLSFTGRRCKRVIPPTGFAAKRTTSNSENTLEAGKNRCYY
jgi:hypothetical protein